MKDWDAATWFGLAALIVALVALPVTIWATRRWGDRRARLLFTYRSVPLLPISNTEALKVTYRDFEVPSPHLVTLRLRNIGPRDIASSHFDQGRPFQIDLNARFYGLVDASPKKERGTITVAPIGTDDGYLAFTPALLRRNQEWTAEVLVSGDSEPQFTSSLVDTDIVAADEDSSTATEEVATAVLQSLGLVGHIAAAISRSTRFGR